MSDRENTLDDDDLVIEVDGKGVHLATLDARAVLELATAYIELLARIADDNDESIEFTGLKAVEKCGALATRPSDVVLARRSAVDADRIMASVERPAHGLVTFVDRVRVARARLPRHYRAMVKVQGFERDITAEPRGNLTESPLGTMAVRAYCSRVGGNRPRAMYRSKSEPRAFSLDVPVELALRLRHHVFSTVDIVASTARDRDGSIEYGTLLEFFPLSSVDPNAAWRDWYRESAIQSLDEPGDDDPERKDGRSGDRS